ncbi:Uncharacterised protein [Mycobacteroides abscessus subsp. abscessus]|nr:Uncharacterised protein [Mycobacteroides abscessus subsp. abscessus]
MAGKVQCHRVAADLAGLFAEILARDPDVPEAFTAYGAGSVQVVVALVLVLGLLDNLFDGAGHDSYLSS